MTIASCCTNKAEKNYAQIDLEAMAIDFTLRRFRSYLVGSPNQTVVITDHSPLISIFNGKCSGSIRTERIKLRHQDIRFIVDYQKGQNNPADYLLKHHHHPSPNNSETVMKPLGKAMKIGHSQNQIETKTLS